MHGFTLVKVSALAITLALGSVSAQAQQPPAQVGIAGGTQSTPNVITGTAFEQLAFADVTIPNTNSPWHCVATCSTEVGHITGVSVRGFIAITRAGVAQPATSRAFELNDNPGENDPNTMEVSTTGLMQGFLASTQRIACAAAKISASQPNFNVIDSSLTVVCVDRPPL